MSDHPASLPPGSRAIKIPLNLSNSPDYMPITRRRRSERFMKTHERADSSDAGPSSLSSDPESPWSYNLTPGQARDHFRTVASPSGQGTQLPATSPLLDNTGSTQRKDKQKAGYPPPSSMPTLFNPSSSPLGPSMLASSSYKSINLNGHHGDPDEPPRLITYTKHSQGFTWNDELFLPSYMLGRYGERGRKKQYDGDFGDEEHCPVAEIFVTDEEADAMMP
ncbi:hypothetical protein EDD37DRAFT_192623 [Exophiala viscosa]|uniref:Uncharacterized protein n=1 Tax=Exophiala viscosa TaxID=2486360 RepID=A0AAN6DNL1_9EURO|nr:hypothetical protein EDD36DRAFT_447445 [Exophiala viscosa]KAI1619792.1 hypothetical protein EDD37DRAFT_192623 [Exophiala viscosa]